VTEALQVIRPLIIAVCLFLLGRSIVALPCKGKGKGTVIAVNGSIP